MLQPDYLRSMTINGLLKDYAAVAPHLKFLRAEMAFKATHRYFSAEDEQIETARSQASEWFNRVFNLYANGLLSVADLQLVASPRAAQLFVDHVAPLDRVVREAAHGPDAEGAVHPVEAFWRDYALGQLRVFTR